MPALQLAKRDNFASREPGVIVVFVVVGVVALFLIGLKVWRVAARKRAERQAIADARGGK